MKLFRNIFSIMMMMLWGVVAVFPVGCEGNPCETQCSLVPHGPYFPYYSCYDPCLEPCCLGSFKVSVDYIYWKPCVDDLDYAAIFTNVITAGINEQTLDYRNIHTDFKSGIRVNFFFPEVCGRVSLMASYTWMNGADKGSHVAKDTEVIISTLLPPVMGVTYDTLFTKAKASYLLNYQSWDFLVAYPYTFCGRHLVLPFIGVEGIHISQKIKSDLEGTLLGTIQWDSKFDAVGLKAGQRYEYRLCRCLKFFSKASATLAVGAPKEENESLVTNSAVTTGTMVETHDKFDCHLFPGYHLQAGVTFEDKICCVDYAIHLGWDFVGWVNMPNQRTFIGGKEEGNLALSSSSDVRTIGYHGLMVGAEVKF